MLTAEQGSETQESESCGKVGTSRGVSLLTPLPSSLEIRVSFTFQDLVDSDVSHKLLHRVILQVAIAPVHLQSLVADLRG